MCNKVLFNIISLLSVAHCNGILKNTDVHNIELTSGRYKGWTAIPSKNNGDENRRSWYRDTNSPSQNTNEVITSVPEPQESNIFYNQYIINSPAPETQNKPNPISKPDYILGYQENAKHAKHSQSSQAPQDQRSSNSEKLNADFIDEYKTFVDSTLNDPQFRFYNLPKQITLDSTNSKLAEVIRLPQPVTILDQARLKPLNLNTNEQIAHHESIEPLPYMRPPSFKIPYTQLLNLLELKQINSGIKHESFPSSKSDLSQQLFPSYNYQNHDATRYPKIPFKPPSKPRLIPEFKFITPKRKLYMHAPYSTDWFNSKPNINSPVEWSKSFGWSHLNKEPRTYRKHLVPYMREPLMLPSDSYGRKYHNSQNQRRGLRIASMPNVKYWMFKAKPKNGDSNVYIRRTSYSKNPFW